VFGIVIAIVVGLPDYSHIVGNHLAGLVLAKFAQLYTQPTSWKEIKSDSTLFTPDFEALLQQSQTPDKVDDIEKIRKDLDETQETLHKTINDLLVRGQKLDDLADQSEDLGVFSREFLKRSESMNGGCCLLL
jgi:synaptobrevin family protein YKT6